MGKKRAGPSKRRTSWAIPDDVWRLIQTILNKHYPAKPKGHRRIEFRRVLNGIIFHLRTGLSMESTPGALWGRQHGTLPFPALVPTWDLGLRLVFAGRDLCRGRRGGL